MKQILIIEKPNGCWKCPANNCSKACGAARRPFPEYLITPIRNGEPVNPHWCPLVDLPEKRLDWTGDGYDAGWNDCLKAIGINTECEEVSNGY